MEKNVVTTDIYMYTEIKNIYLYIMVSAVVKIPADSAEVAVYPWLHALCTVSPVMMEIVPNS